MKSRHNKILFITKIAVLAAMSFALYWIKFPIFSVTPWLKVQFSDIPTIIGGLMLGPIGGAIIVVLRFVLKLMFTSTGGIGEIADLIIGMCTMLTSSIIYKNTKNKVGAISGLVMAWLTWIAVSALTNKFILLPVFFKGAAIDSEIYLYTIFFNLILASIVLTICFILYCALAKIFQKDFSRMKKSALICCDSFKGTMTSNQVNKAVAEELAKVGYDTKCVTISDGGEGLLDAIYATDNSYNIKTCETVDAIGRNNTSRYLYNQETKTAIFCLADAVGIGLMKESELSCYHANTYGLGLVIRYAITHDDVKHMVLGIGGSASTDAGSGMLEALGVKFYDENDNLLTGMDNAKLASVKNIDVTEFKDLIKDIKAECLTDVVNPLYGLNGAAFIYGKQKGGNDQDLIVMDQNLQIFAKVCSNTFGYDLSTVPGTGAAGGVGYAMVAFFNAELTQGIKKVLELANFGTLVKNYDLVITGEGSLDSQSFQGKVISGILEYQPKNIKFICGLSKVNKDENFDYDIYSIVPTITDPASSMANPEYYLRELIKQKFTK